MSTLQIQKNLKEIKAKLKRPTKLLAVSKTKPSEYIRIAFESGQLDFGENKVMELLEKSEDLSDLNINWHFIGHLQSNKINHLLRVKNLVSIHSIDSEKLLRKILSKKPLQKIGLFLQLNISGEQEKSGFLPNENLADLIKLILDSENYFLQGIMGIGKIRTESFREDAENGFLLLKNIKEKLDNDHDMELELSMGMSQDFEIAMEYGSNWVRIGSFIFGKRD